MKHSFSSLSMSAAMLYQWNMAQVGYKTSLSRVCGLWTATAHKQERKGSHKDLAA